MWLAGLQQVSWGTYLCVQIYPKWFSAILYTSVAFMFVNSRGKCTTVKQAELEFLSAWEGTRHGRWGGRYVK
jgi:hypothetical protein